MNKLIANIGAERGRMGWTQKELCKRAKLSRRAWYRIRKHPQKITLEELQNLAEAFGCSMEMLFDYSLPAQD